MSVIGFLKKFVNSTIGTSGAKPIDQMLNEKLNQTNKSINNISGMVELTYENVEELLERDINTVFRYETMSGVYTQVLSTPSDFEAPISSSSCVVYQDSQGKVVTYNPVVRIEENGGYFSINVYSHNIFRNDSRNYTTEFETIVIYLSNRDIRLYNKIQKHRILLDDNNICYGYEIYNDYEEKNKTKSIEKSTKQPIEKIALNQNTEDEEERKENYIIFRTLDGLKNIKNVHDIVGRKFNERTEQFEMVGDGENGRTKQ